MLAGIVERLGHNSDNLGALNEEIGCGRGGLWAAPP